MRAHKKAGACSGEVVSRSVWVNQACDTAWIAKARQRCGWGAAGGEENESFAVQKRGLKPSAMSQVAQWWSVASAAVWLAAMRAQRVKAGSEASAWASGWGSLVSELCSQASSVAWGNGKETSPPEQLKRGRYRQRG